MPRLSATGPGNPNTQRNGAPAAVARELSLLRTDDRNRVTAALRTRHDNGLLMLSLARGNTRKLRTLIHELLIVTAERGIDDVTRMLRQRERPDAAAPQRNWARLRDAFLAEFDTATPRELANLTGSRARNAAARAYDWAKAGRIFGVNDGRETRYPLFQLKDGKPVPVTILVEVNFRLY